jgi:RHS repeat-associated protein
MTSKTDSGGADSYTYDTADRLATVKDPLGNTSSFGYTADSMPSTITYPGNLCQSWTYDLADKATQALTKPCGGSTWLVYDYTYATNPSTNNPTDLLHTTYDWRGTTTTYTYDSLERLTQASENVGGSTYVYGYDNVGNMTSYGTHGTPTSYYTYNAADELCAVDSAVQSSCSGTHATAYTYDGNGNRTGYTGATSQTVTYNAQDQATNFTTGGTSTGVTYLGAGQTQRVHVGSASYQYDDTGITQQTTGGQTTYFTTGPDGQLISERIPNGSGGWNVYYYFFDGLGNVTGIGNAQGMGDWYVYTPYGGYSSDANGSHFTIANPFTFQASINDSTDSVYQMGERYYDPSTGQFTQQDPLGGGDQYGYDNPLRFTDRSGLKGEGGSDEYGGVELPRSGASYGGDGGGSNADNAGKAETGERVVNQPPAAEENTWWNSLERAKQGWRRSGTGSKTRYYKFDYLHNEVEVYDSRGRHLGARNPKTGEPIPGKGPVKGRTAKP